jgi:hypothetical protein
MMSTIPLICLTFTNLISGAICMVVVFTLRINQSLQLIVWLEKETIVLQYYLHTKDVVVEEELEATYKI